MNNIVSIAFITYNRAQELIRAIDSCIHNDSLQSQIIIWDNHSDDENRTIIKEYVSQYDNIDYHYSESNKGVSAGRNAVFNLCNSKYVLFVDDDAVLETPDFVKHAVEYMIIHPEVGAAGFDIDEPESGMKLICPYREKNNDIDPETLCYVGACHIIDKSAIKEVCLYPESLFFGSEELYLSMLLRVGGKKIVEISTLKALHMPSKINRFAGKERKQMFIVNQYIIKLMLYPSILRPVFFIMLCLRLLKQKIGLLSTFTMIRNRYCENRKEKLTFSKWRDCVKKFGLMINI